MRPTALSAQATGLNPTLPPPGQLRVLVIDIGGTSVKFKAPGHEEKKFSSGPKLTPEEMVKRLREETAGWEYDAVAIGYPGPVTDAGIAREPVNLGRGWVGFDFEAALGKPVKVVNDAAMQALGSYQGGGRMLFLGLGTGLGTALVDDGKLIALEAGHLPYGKHKHDTFEDAVGKSGLERDGEKKWRKHVADVVERLKAATVADYVVIGGGNVKKLDELPPGAIAGSNALAFVGGERLWNG